MDIGALRSVSAVGKGNEVEVVSFVKGDKGRSIKLQGGSKNSREKSSRCSSTSSS